jgi:hypothetical protein
MPTLDSTYVLFQLNTLKQDTQIAKPLTPKYEILFNDPLNKAIIFHQNLGVNGSRYQILQTQEIEKYQEMYNPYSLLFIKPLDLKWLKEGKTFTHIQYQLASQLQQSMNANFYKLIAPKHQLGFTFNRITSRGLFVEVGNLINGELQKTTLSNVILQYKMTSKSNRFTNEFAVLANTYKTRETGGITSDSLYQILVNRQLANMPQNMIGSNKITDKSAYFKTQFQPNFKLIKEKLTIIPLNKSYFFESNYKVTHAVYQDSERDSMYYNQFYYDTKKSFDSTRNRSFTNRVGLQFLETKDAYKDKIITRKIASTFILQHQAIRHSQHLIDTNFTNTNLQIVLHSQTFLPFTFHIASTYYFDGINKNGYEFSLNALKRFKKNYTFQFDFNKSKTMPSINESMFSGNHSSWNQSFKFKQLQRIDASISYKDLIHLTLKNCISKNGIYYNLNQGAIQDNKGFTQNTIELKTNVSFKKLNITSKSSYQYFVKNAIIDIPKLLSFVDISYPFKLSSTHLNLGTTLRYFSAYKAMQFAPDINRFVINSTFIKQQFRADLYAMLQIKRFSFVLKGTQLQSLITQNKSYTTPLYPVLPAGINFGFDWNFFD